MATCIDLLRHGDTGQRGFRGHLDDPLTAQGWQQMQRTVDGAEWDAVVASPLQRCAAFAQALAGARGLPLHLDARWREYGFGQWQDVPVDVLAREQGEALARFWADPAAHPPPGAEPFAEFAARVQAAYAALYARPGRVLVVTHGGPIRWLRCIAAGSLPSAMSAIDVAHASLHRLPTHGPTGAAALASMGPRTSSPGERQQVATMTGPAADAFTTREPI